MLHAFEYISFIVALVCAVICFGLLVILGLSILDYVFAKQNSRVVWKTQQPSQFVWQIPAWVGALGVFWAVVALGLHHLMR